MRNYLIMVLEEIKQKIGQGEKQKTLTKDEFITEMIRSGGMTEFKAKKWITVAERSGYIKIDHKNETIQITDMIAIEK